jgi:ComF family protein
MVNNWRNIIQDCLLPPSCLLCGKPGINSLDLCKPCRDLLPTNDHCCFRCGQPFTPSIPHPTLCGQCQNQQIIFDKTHTPFIYTGAIRHLIQTLKFNAHHENARLLGTLLADFVYPHADRPECILPVPLHKHRYRERGFNQAIEIARVVASRLKIQLDLSSCQRQHNTAHQTELSARQRRVNLRNAFLINRPLFVQHVAILDDVMTTGSTANELAKTLKKSGVKRVDIWVCARA